VPVSAVNIAEEMADNPQVLADGIMWDLEHSVTGPQRVVGPSAKLSRTPTRVARAAPALGEHTLEVLHEAGFTQPEMDELVAAGIVVRWG
jgi:crotonobetainyl-CoA:carnitine CoA-transferase CaiB-like acyl-CoA transferase